MCMYDGGEPAKFYNTKERVARKPHACSECGREISSGEPYRYVSAMWDGDWRPHSIYTCAHCAVSQDWLLRECDGFLHEAVLEDLREHIIGAAGVFNAERGYGSGPARLVVGMRRQWRRFDKSGLMPTPTLPEITAHSNAAEP